MDRQLEDLEIAAGRATPAGLLAEGKAHQVAGRLCEAEECFALALDGATETNDGAAMSEALRRLGILHHLQGGTVHGVHYCERSRDVAMGSSNRVLAAEATMALANMACDQGRMPEARDLFAAARELATGHSEVVARIENNLGIVESVQGNLSAALDHYQRALAASELSQHVLGRARALHNIGMICADQKDWNGAYRAYEQAASLARQGGDYQLQGLCLLNRAEIDMAHQRYDEVRRQVENALVIFSRLGARVDMASAFRMLERRTVFSSAVRWRSRDFVPLWRLQVRRTRRWRRRSRVATWRCCSPKRGGSTKHSIFSIDRWRSSGRSVRRSMWREYRSIESS